MFRLKIALIIGGGILGFFGYQEFKVSSGSTKEPEAVEIKALETDSAVGNTHLTIGKHAAVYSRSVYQYETSSAGASVDDGTKVNYCYYPIISLTHPIFTKELALEMQYGSYEKIPKNQRPEVENLAVIVKSKRFGTIGGIPKETQDEDAVTGLVINRIKKLSGEERNLIQQSFPKVDLDKVLLLEEGRTPTSSMNALAMIAGGALLIIIGIVTFFVGGKQEAAPVSENRRAF